jgi:hypothetical protein
MNRPDIEAIEKQLKRGTGYRRMQGTALQLILWINHLEEENGDLMNDYQSIGEEFAGLADDYDDLEQEVRDLREEKRRRE